MVVATPVIGASGSPALNVSTVWAIHGTPTFFWIRSMTCLAVNPFCCDKVRSGVRTATTSAPLSRWKNRFFMVGRVLNDLQKMSSETGGETAKHAKITKHAKKLFLFADFPNRIFAK